MHSLQLFLLNCKLVERIDIKKSSTSLLVILEPTINVNYVWSQLLYIWLHYDALVCRHIICNSSDLAPECPNPHDRRYYPERILLYDQHPGGLGVSVQVNDMKLGKFNQMLIYVPRLKANFKVNLKVADFTPMAYRTFGSVNLHPKCLRLRYVQVNIFLSSFFSPIAAAVMDNPFIYLDRMDW